MSVIEQSSVTPISTYDYWHYARQRTRTYLNLHRFPADLCEELLQVAELHLPTKPPHAEQQQIQLFIKAVQQVAQELIGCPYTAQLTASGRSTGWSVRTTPKLERSSVRIASLRAISLSIASLRAAVGHS